MKWFRGKREKALIKEDPQKCEYQCRHKHRHRYGEHCREWALSMKDKSVHLSECPAGSLCIISSNPNKMTKEIGLNPGKTVSVFKNEISDNNMIICLETTRYIVAKSIAKKVAVRPYIPDENDIAGLQTKQ